METFQKYKTQCNWLNWEVISLFTFDLFFDLIYKVLTSVFKSLNLSSEKKSVQKNRDTVFSIYIWEALNVLKFK